MTWRTIHLSAALAGVTAFTALAVLVRTGRTLFVDDAILCWVGGLRGPVANGVAGAITRIGSGLFLIPIALMVTGWLWKKREKAVAWIYFATVLSGWAGYGILKAAFARPRPDLIPRLGSAGWWSFPSGHAMGTTIVLGFAVILLTRSAWLRLATALLVLAIAFSRVYLGVHYPSDVLAGVFGGCAWISAALAVLAVERVPGAGSRKEA